MLTAVERCQEAKEEKRSLCGSQGASAFRAARFYHSKALPQIGQHAGPAASHPGTRMKKNDKYRRSLTLHELLLWREEFCGFHISALL
jgi:hypothetical protein